MEEIIKELVIRYTYYKAIFNWVLKRTRIFSGFASRRCVAGLKFNRSEIITNLDLLSRICFPALLFASNSHLFNVFLTSVVIGRQNGYFGFGFTQLKTAVSLLN